MSRLASGDPDSWLLAVRLKILVFLLRRYGRGWRLSPVAAPAADRMRSSRLPLGAREPAPPRPVESLRALLVHIRELNHPTADLRARGRSGIHATPA